MALGVEYQIMPSTCPRQDLNLWPPACRAGALTGLSYTDLDCPHRSLLLVSVRLRACDPVGRTCGGGFQR